MVKYYSENDPQSAEQIKSESSLYWSLFQPMNDVLLWLLAKTCPYAGLRIFW
jgi:hypothetical protein